MPDETAVTSGARARTRKAILDAAVLLLSQDHAASLNDIATAAGVGRTTLHRYFAERSDLLKALGDHVLEQIKIATEYAALQDGPAPDALERLCRAYFDLGDILMFMFHSAPESMSGTGWNDTHAKDHPLYRLIERGQAEGSIDRQFTAVWVEQVLWALLYAAWQHVKENSVPRHQALALCQRSLRKSITP